ncbi:MAG: hypothetical protein AAF513_16845, partial [Pseudomonadota bacterium]
YLYEKLSPQSSAIGSREELLASLQNLSLPEPLIAPDGARGLLLTLDEIERLDLTMENGVHDRRSWQRQGSAWVENVLVP